MLLVDTAVSASLWVGTSQGSILVIVINLPAPGEPRLTQPVMVAPSGSVTLKRRLVQSTDISLVLVPGSIFRVKGSMVCLAFLEPTGGIISPPSEPWRDESKEPRDASRSRTPTRSGLTTPLSGAAGDALSSDNQYAVMVSEKQARVVSLPSQTCLYRANMTPSDSVFVVTANVISIKGQSCALNESRSSPTQFPCLQRVLAWPVSYRTVTSRCSVCPASGRSWIPSLLL